MNEKINFENLSKEWLEYKHLNVKYSTVVKYQNIIKCHLMEIDQDKPLYLWEEKDYQEWYKNTIEIKHLSVSIQNSINCILKDILNYAERKYHFKHFDFSFMKNTSENKEIQTLLKDEYHKLCDYCQNYINPNTVSIYIAMYTGMRIGEVCGLKWEDVNLNNQTILVSRTVQRIKNDDPEGPKTKKMIFPPKTRSSKRLVVMTDYLTEYLRTYKLIMKPKEESCFIITNSHEIPEVRNIQRNFKIICNSLKIKLNFHGLRHSFATKCIESNADYKTVSVLLGHSNISVTMNLYVHPSLEYKKEQINKITKF